MTLTIDERISLAEQAGAEGRIIQGAWRKPPRGPGRELVCALAAFGPDINSASDCPADLMPQWLAELVPTLDDGIAAKDVPWFFSNLVERARKWQVFDEAAWERIRTGFLIAAIRQALDSAAKVQPEPKPAYWQKVVSACEGVIAALNGQGDLEAAARAAWAAAAVTAEAAAARAAAVMAWAVTAEAAWAVTAWAVTAWVGYRQLCETLFALIDAELAEQEQG